MAGFVDLHCHWVAGIDDGARTTEEGVQMLDGLGRIGFVHVVATPHMRPGMFDNDRPQIETAFSRMLAEVGHHRVERSLGSEHFFDALVLERMTKGEALSYTAAAMGAKPILVEFADLDPLPVIERYLFRLQTLGYLPVIAHPERYRAAWSDPEVPMRLAALGSVLLLDVAALEGKYGQSARKASLWLLEREAYGAACSDSHRPADVEIVERAMDQVSKLYGSEELDFLFDEGPREILAGRRPIAG